MSHHYRDAVKMAEIKSVPQQDGQKSIHKALATTREKDVEMTKEKFEIAYFFCKEEIPMSKYEKVIELEAMHGVDISNVAYANAGSCVNFIDFMGEEIANELNNDLSKGNFFSVLWDGPTDRSVLEQEVPFVLYFDLKPIGKEKVQVKTSFLGLRDVKHGHAEGGKEHIMEAFENLGETFFIETRV